MTRWFPKLFIVGTNSDALHDTMNGVVVGEIVRCRDCRYWNDIEILKGTVCTRFIAADYVWHSQSDDFCSLAERRRKE